MENHSFNRTHWPWANRRWAAEKLGQKTLGWSSDTLGNKGFGQQIILTTKTLGKRRWATEHQATGTKAKRRWAKKLPYHYSIAHSANTKRASVAQNRPGWNSRGKKYKLAVIVSTIDISSTSKLYWMPPSSTPTKYNMRSATFLVVPPNEICVTDL